MKMFPDITMVEKPDSLVTGEGTSQLPEIAGFKEQLALFYRANRRDFPWRENITPYRIIVSEIMLQQTGVERVLGKFDPFVARFPDFCSLSRASLADVMNVWQGLGYNKRALSLKKLAGIVMEKYSGGLPDDPKLLKALPGIGEATAGAIMAFAFNLPSVFIETNIRRVFIHHFFPDREKVADSDIVPIVAAAIDRSCPREWYYALMDYGTYLGTVSVNPNRKSTRYSRQSPFQDSDRQVRGKVIKSLIGSGKASAKDLSGMTGCLPERLAPILESLIKDGLIKRDKGLYRIT
jgi:A/G-specific adenine glycosylase